MVAVWLSW